MPGKPLAEDSRGERPGQENPGPPGQLDRDPVEKLAEEFAERLRRCERPSIEDYVAAQPDCADQIRQLFPTLVLMEELGPDDDSTPGAASPRTRFEAAPLQRLGDFRVVREVGRGGMGVVYE